MNQCLRCQQPCRDDTEFCENCRIHLQKRLQISKVISQPVLTAQTKENALATVRYSKQASDQSIIISPQNDTIVPLALAPLDEYAFPPPIPTVPISKRKKTVLIKDDAIENIKVANNLELEDAGESDALLYQSDPLLSRRLPNSTASLIIEQEDYRRAIDQGEVLLRPASNAFPHQQGSRTQIALKVPEHLRLRIALFLLIIVVVVALIASSVLIFLNTARQSTHTNVSKALPALSVTPGIAHLNQIVQLHMKDFSPSAKIRLTHDVQESVRTGTNAPFIKLGATGDGNVQIFVDDSWGPGSRLIQAEDINTHFTASTVLQVLNDLPLRPPHLLVSRSGVRTALKGQLDMGSNEQGANTLQSLVLRNSGGGWISWSAVSNQPWLMTSPQQGIFRDGQNIIVAVTRANLNAGKYEGTITIVSNAASPLSVQVKMTVLSLPASVKAVSSIMLVTPPLLSFVATDGGTDPASQMLTISNPGSQPLTWSLNVSAIQDSFNQNFSSQYDVTWLNASMTSGTVFSGKNVGIQIHIHSNNLLPSVYSALLTFTSGLGTLNAPQTVAISLTVQPRCGIATNLGNMSFTSISGQSTTGNQLLSLSITPGCTGTVNWQSFSSSSWLSITPEKGELQAKVNSIVTVQISAGGLQPGIYSGSLLFVAQQRSQTVIVQLIVRSSSTSTAVEQPTGSPGTSFSDTVLAISPQSFQFTVTQGQGNLAVQQLVLSNTGQGSLNWQANIDSFAAPWLSVNPITGTIDSAQSTQVGVSASSAGLSAGNYSTQITVTAVDNSGNQAQGSPQTIPVILTVLPGCSFQVTPASLSFAAKFSQPKPPGQEILLAISGSCPQSILWTATVNTGSQSWLNLSATSGTVDKQGSAVTVKVRSRPLFPGVYAGRIVISASDRNGDLLQNSPVSIPVTLTIR